MENVETVISKAKPVASFEQNILLTAKGGSVMFVGKLFNQFSRLVITLLLTRLLGPAQYGLYNIALSAAAIASHFALVGLGTALVRYVALYAGRRDEQAVWGSIQIAVGISTALSALISALLFALSHVIATEVFHDATLAPVLQLISFTIPLLSFSDVLAGATRGFKRIEHMVIAQNIAQPLVRMLLLLAFSLVGLNIMQAVVIFGVADFVASLLLIYFLNSQFPLRRPLHAARRAPREMLSYSIPMWLADTIATFRGNIQTILLGSLSSVFTVGVFAVANQLNQFADLVHHSVTTAVQPIIVQVHDSDNREQLGRLYQTVSKWMFSFNVPIFLIVVMFPTPILSIFGKDFTQGATALTLLSWASLVNAGTGMCGLILDMTGYTKLKLANSVSQLALIVILSTLLIPTLGMVGAAVAALAGQSVINVLRVVEIYIIFRLLPYNASFLKPILAGVSALLVTLIAGNWLPVSDGNLQALALIPLLACAYVGAILLFGLEPEDRAILARVRKRATRKLSQNRA
ncbi:MAG: oligosaccharide flippase family protein [Chloroflexi bacterium]|nr:oligosaccharide flippase family protein [Chloroflexota bacterium]